MSVDDKTERLYQRVCAGVLFKDKVYKTPHQYFTKDDTALRCVDCSSEYLKVEREYARQTKGQTKL